MLSPRCCCEWRGVVANEGLVNVTDEQACEHFQHCRWLTNKRWCVLVAWTGSFVSRVAIDEGNLLLMMSKIGLKECSVVVHPNLCTVARKVARNGLKARYAKTTSRFIRYIQITYATRCISFHRFASPFFRKRISHYWPDENFRNAVPPSVVSNLKSTRREPSLALLFPP